MSKQDTRTSYDEVSKSNERFEHYYNTLGLVPAGQERDAFWAAYKRELPNAFRFTGSRGHAQVVKTNLTERFFPLIAKIEHEGKPVELPKPIPWFPDGLAYSMTTPKNVVRKYEPFKEFQKFLVSETGVGNISRQEQVSMIPPLLLDVQPHHTVLDLCAAPGSKSAQLIEAIHVGEEERVEQAVKRSQEVGDSQHATTQTEHYDQGRSTGLLVANDVNYQRAQMLVHQVKRLNSPNIIVTNHDATMMPSLALPANDASRSAKKRYLKFDRILADVPCSGDGTVRKNVNVWKDWSPVNALGLYLTQVRILVRALQMLKAGGRVVYSTCSLNPLEDEAVVASAIERCGGTAKVKIVDCSDKLPELKRVPGLTDWSIMARSGQIYESWEEAQQFELKDTKVKVTPGMFPPLPEEQIQLERCMRVYPHLQDTGGFFICVLEKQSELKAKQENESKCSNRDWSFKAAKSDQNKTAASETPVSTILKELQNAPKDHSGLPTTHIRSVEELVPAPLTEEDESAAQRSNEAPMAVSSKRKADDDTDTGLTKRSKISDLDGTEDNDAIERTGVLIEAAGGEIQREHLPLPPSVTEALLASTHPHSHVSSANGNLVGEQPTAIIKNGRPDTSGEAFKYLAPDHPELIAIEQFYQIDKSFPRDRFLVRNHAGDPVKGIYYTSQLVKDVLIANVPEGVKFVHAGVKMFMKQDAQKQENVCRWRIQTEGLPIIEGWVGEDRVVKLWRRSTLRHLLIEMFPKLGGPAGEEGWRKLGEIGERVRDMPMGCCVLRVEAGKQDGDEGFTEPLNIPLWRSLYSLNLMLPKEERKALLLRVYNEEPELVNDAVPKEAAKEAS